MNDHQQTDQQSIFAARAETLASPIKKLDENAKEMILVFYIGKEKYAMETQDIMRILTPKKITAFPFFPDIFSGLLYYDGVLFPVIKTRSVLNNKNESEPHHIILIEYGEKNIALPINEIIGRIPYRQNQILLQSNASEYNPDSIMNGIYEHDISVISVQKLFHLIEKIAIVDFKGE